MDKKVTGIIAYITLVGWLIAYLAGDKEGAKFHLNQALVLLLVFFVAGLVVGFLPGFIGSILGWVVSVAQVVFIVLGLVSAIKEEEKELPFIGGIKILK